MANKPKVDPYAHIGEPSSRPVRWQVSCSEYQRVAREEKGTIARSASVIVEAQTWIEARDIAFRHFAEEHQIYEPEDVAASILPDTKEIAPPTAGGVSIVDASHPGVAPPVDFAGMNVPTKDDAKKKSKEPAR